MDPISLGLGIASFVLPKIGKYFFGENGKDVADKVIDITKSVAGKDDPEAAFDAIKKDPQLALQLKEKLLDFHLALEQEETERQKQDTARFVSMNDGDAEKVRATARPQIALRAMAVVETFATVFKWLAIATLVEWAVRTGYTLSGHEFPDTVSLINLIAGAKPVAEMIWVPLLGSFWACVSVIKTYMGCRERDKAQQYEMANGKPLESSRATVQAAGGVLANVANVVKAFKSG